MSQVVKLKRTAVEGKVPNTSNIELGELAINTYDGRIFFEKDNGTPTIQQVVTTNSQTTGSLNILGTVTASYFVGNGSQLTNLPNPDVSQVATVTSSFDNQSSISVNHNFDTKNVIISVYQSNDTQIIPSSVTLTNNNTATIGLSSAQSGYVVVAKGGHIVSGSIIASASFTELTNLPNGLVSGSSQLTSSYDSRYVLSGSITQTTWDNIANKPLGIISGSSQLTSSYDIRYALSGSNQSTFNRTVESYTATEGQTIFTTTGSASVDNVDVYINGLKLLTSDFNVTNSNTITLTTGSLAGEEVEINLYSAFSGTYLTTQDLNGFISSSSQVQFNTINNTPFSQSANNVTISKSLVPTTSTIDLGTAEKPFRDLYLSSASLYIDGQQVISSNASELVITTDVGQSIKLLEAGADDIILQTEDGNIELKGTVELQTGKKIIDSGGTQILFGNSIGITGSISLSGTVDGVDVSQLKSDFDGVQGKSLISGSSQVVGILSSLNTYTSSNDIINTTQNSRLTSLETKSGSVDTSISNINSFTSSNGNTALNDYTSSLKTALSVSGQNVTINGNFAVSGTQTIVDSTTVQIGDNIIELNGSGAANGGIQVKDVTIPNTATGSLIWDSTNDYWKAGVKDSEVKILLANGDNVVSGSSQVVGILSSLNTYTGSNDTTNTTQNSRLTALESTTGSYETKGRGIVSGSSQVSYTGLSNIPSGIVSGSSQITLSSTTGYGSVINQAVLTTSSPTFANVTATSFVLGNGQFLRGTRTSGGLVINLLGIESGTDRTMMTITGDYVIQNGSNTALLTMTTSGNSTFAGNVLPTSNNAQDLGSAAASWRNIYTNDLHLSNEGKPEGNDVDGTTGNWTIQEGTEHLYIINNKTGKKFKFSLEEIQ